MFSNKNSGGFVLAEFAIALPLLILLGVGLANVGAKIFQLGKNQLADYVLENEASYAIERIVHQARAAKEIEITPFEADIDQIKIYFRTVRDDPVNVIANVAEVRETQYFIPRFDSEREIYTSLNAKRIEVGTLGSPITGGNSFGDTKITKLKYKLNESEKILHITLEMESLVSGHKIKIATAVFMPGYGEGQ